MRDLLLHLQPSAQTSLQSQIREKLVSAILGGQLSAEERLPSSRHLAKALGVSRNTVTLAYQGLMDDGFLIGKERSGYYVNAEAVDFKPPDAKHPTGAGIDWASRLTARPSRQANISKPLDWQSYSYPFIYGQVDHNLFPINEWRECAREALGKRWLGTWTNDTWAHDDPLLVEQIRRRILPRRGIMASEDEILVTLGGQNGLFLAASLLVGRSTRVVMEEPGFADVRNIFRLQSDQVTLQPVDDGGLVVSPTLNAAQVVFVTPSHQSPTTATMPLDRRLALLKLASQRDIVVIEDDYEFETNYVNEPCPALKSLDDDGRVIYVGSFSKTLFPGLRLGFLVGPKPFIEEARALRRLMVRHAPNNNQRTAALFLSLGHHDTLIRRLHRAYRTRWEIMGEALKRYMPGSTRTPSFGGTCYWVRGPDGLDSEELAVRAKERSVLIEPGRVHFGAEPAPRSYFRLGFSSIEERRIEPGIKIVAELVSARPGGGFRSQ
ncbi:MAG: PLP-dependent aminotransferase family protein [Hyphomicrobiaceae bacterium]